MNKISNSRKKFRREPKPVGFEEGTVVSVIFGQESKNGKISREVTALVIDKYKVMYIIITDKHNHLNNNTIEYMIRRAYVSSRAIVGIKKVESSPLFLKKCGLKSIVDDGGFIKNYILEDQEEIKRAIKNGQ